MTAPPDPEKELSRVLMALRLELHEAVWGDVVDRINAIMKLTREAAFAAGAAAEREECAKIADNYYVSSVAGQIANQIRARSATTKPEGFGHG